MIRMQPHLPAHCSGVHTYSGRTNWLVRVLGFCCVLASTPVYVEGADNNALSPAAIAGEMAVSAGSNDLATGEFVFDMDAQRLSDALDTFATVTGRAVMFQDRQVAGVLTSALRGSYTAQEALDKLLVNTGLVSERVGGQQKSGFVLKADAKDNGMSGEKPSAQLDRRFDHVVQWRIWESLCSDALTKPGQYRVLLQVGIDREGVLSQVKLLTSTGDRNRDARIYSLLKGRQMGVKPTAELSQPLVIMIMQKDTMFGKQCGERG